MISKISYKFIPLPQEIIDFFLPQLNESELKVLLFIARRTLGFGKESDAISMSQFREGITSKLGKRLCSGTGLTNESIQKALFVLEKVDYITTQRSSTHTSIYKFNLQVDIANFLEKDFSSIRNDYKERPRKEVSNYRKETFLQNRTYYSNRNVPSSLLPRNTVSLVTENTLQKTEEDTFAAKAANGAAQSASPTPTIQSKKSHKKTENTISGKEKNVFMSRMTEVGFPVKDAREILKVTTRETLERQLSFIQESPAKSRAAYIQSIIYQYTS